MQPEFDDTRRRRITCFVVNSYIFNFEFWCWAILPSLLLICVYRDIYNLKELLLQPNYCCKRTMVKMVAEKIPLWKNCFLFATTVAFWSIWSETNEFLIKIKIKNVLGHWIATSAPSINGKLMRRRNRLENWSMRYGSIIRTTEAYSCLKTVQYDFSNYPQNTRAGFSAYGCTLFEILFQMIFIAKSGRANR